MKKIISICFLFLIVIACSKSEDKPVLDDNSSLRTTLLTNWADNIIVPSYVNFQSKMNLVVANSNTFTTTPNEANLLTLRTSWVEAYKAYQYVAMYSFGKDEEINFKEATNTYPTDVAGINANISSGIYNLGVLSQFKRQGLPAIDYLINGLGANDTEIIAFYVTNSNSVNYKKYLNDVSNKIKTNINLIVVDWNSSYRNAFVANNGIQVTSAVNFTANEFVKNLEKDIRTAKIGFPAGLFSTNNAVKPNNVEAFYKNDISKILLNESIKASQDFFNGKHFNSTTTGIGLKSYLDFVKKNSQLSDLINAQYNKVFAINNALNNSFSSQVTNDNAKMLSSFDALQQNVIYTKVDMTQALNITIDYVDGDGD